MKRLLTLIIALAFLLVPPLFLAAFDWGLNLDNSSGFRYSDNTREWELEQRNKAALWAETSTEKENGSIIDFSVQGIYLYTDERPYLFDIERLVLRSRSPNLLKNGGVVDFAAGRFRFQEPTAVILNHRADGVSIGADHGSVRWSISGAYTGLLLKPESTIEMSIPDLEDSADDNEHLAPRRLFQIAELSFPGFMDRQLLSITSVTQQDLRETDQLHSFHGILSLSGPLSRGLYYNADAALGYNSSEEEASFMGNGLLRYFREDWAYSRFAMGLLYTTEDFFCISTPTIGLINNPGISDLLRINFEYSVRPWGDRMAPAMRNLQFLTSSRLFFTPSEGYSGMELDGGVNFRPASDFGASITGGMYLAENNNVNALVRIELSLGL